MKEKEDLISKLLKEIPLETRITVTIQAYFLEKGGGSFLMPLDEDGNDIPEAIEINRKCFEEAAPLLKNVMEDIEEWKKDGCPKFIKNKK